MIFFFFFKQRTAYEMRISDWSSDVCSSDLRLHGEGIATRLVIHVVQQLVGQHIAVDITRIGCRHHRLGVAQHEIGRASCRERVCQSVSIWVVAVSLKKTTVEVLDIQRIIIKQDYTSKSIQKIFTTKT